MNDVKDSVNSIDQHFQDYQSYNYQHDNIDDDYHSHSHRHGPDEEEHEHHHDHNKISQYEIQLNKSQVEVSLEFYFTILGDGSIEKILISNPHLDRIFRPPIFS